MDTSALIKDFLKSGGKIKKIPLGKKVTDFPCLQKSREKEPLREKAAAIFDLEVGDALILSKFDSRKYKVRDMTYKLNSEYPFKKFAVRNLEDGGMGIWRVS